MPEVVALKDRFAGQDLRIVGLTPESGGDVENVAQFVENMPGLDWPIGYGAEPALAALACEGFPTFYVFDRRGRLVSVGHNHRTAEEAIVQALAR
jgi:hypothetical protein